MRKASIQYYRSFLYSEIDDRDVTYFIIFHLRAIRLAIEELKIYLAKKQKESKKAIKFLRKQPGLNHRQRALLLNALENPDNVYTFSTHMRIHGVVYQTARADLLELNELGLLEMYKSGKRYNFIAVTDLRNKLV